MDPDIHRGYIAYSVKHLGISPKQFKKHFGHIKDQQRLEHTSAYVLYFVNQITKILKIDVEELLAMPTSTLMELLINILNILKKYNIPTMVIYDKKKSVRMIADETKKYQGDLKILKDYKIK